MNVTVPEHLRDILTNRLYGSTPSIPSELSSYLQAHCGIPVADAEKLAWGEPVTLGPDIAHSLSMHFNIHEELLTTILFPTSFENAYETLRRAAAKDLHFDLCQTCDQLQDDLRSVGNDEEVLRSLTMQVLEHLETSSYLAVGDVWSPEIEEALDVLNSLPPDARKRVLAYAYHELSQVSQSLGEI
jgi:hypothetical protein